MNNEELILSELSEIKEDIRDIKKCLYVGNGTKSICSRLDAVETTTGSIKKIMWIVIGSVATLTTSWVALVILHGKP